MNNVCSTWQLVTLGALAALACSPDDSDPNQWGTGGTVQSSGGSSTGGSSTSTGGYYSSGGAGTGGSAAASGSGGSAASGGSGGSGAVTGSGGSGAAVGSGGTAAGGTATGGTATGGTVAATGGVATGTGGVVTGTGGTVTATGGTAAGTGGAATVECSNTDTSLLTIDSARRVNSNCNTAGIQGWWYCYTDGTTTTCPVPESGLFDATTQGLCITGNADGTNWGAGIGLALNQAATTGAAKQAFNATTAGVNGFRITLTGNTGTAPVRLMLSLWATLPAGYVAPFVEVPGLAGTATAVDLMIAEAAVPAEWTETTNAGTTADPASLYDLQIQVVGNVAATAFTLCVTSVQLI